MTILVCRRSGNSGRRNRDRGDDRRRTLHSDLVGIHRDVGGGLAKVLDNIISTIRDRADIHRQVRSLSAEGRLSARMLLALPILVLGFLLTTNSEYLTPMLRNPLGWLLFGVAAVLMGVGTLVIRRIATIRY